MSGDDKGNDKGQDHQFHLHNTYNLFTRNKVAKSSSANHYTKKSAYLYRLLFEYYARGVCAYTWQQHTQQKHSVPTPYFSEM
ncbi:hypothetical protein DEM91_11200 [Prevotella sp. TCVGH]|nr:hypothetical protein [Prevotella sp. TCVGH]